MANSGMAAIAAGAIMMFEGSFGRGKKAWKSFSNNNNR
jgi:hypothetical protein